MVRERHYHYVRTHPLGFHQTEDVHGYETLPYIEPLDVSIVSLVVSTTIS